MKDKIYTKKDYSSNNGMMTTIWGPILWQFLHIMSFNYPVNPNDKNKKEYKIYIYSIFKKTIRFSSHLSWAHEFSLES